MMKITEELLEKNVKTLSFSFSSNSKVTSVKHNNRTSEDQEKLKNYGKHINWDKTSENKILEYHDIKNMYNEIFGDAVNTYNQCQKRKDRKIDNYFNKVKNDGTMQVNKEFIVQVGKVGQNLDDDPEKSRQLQKKILEKYYDEFKETYGDKLHTHDSVIHMDETTPHLHLSVVPEATGYKRGVKVRPSFTKALGIKTEEDYKNFCEDNRTLLKKATEEVLGKTVEREKVGTHIYMHPQALRDAFKGAEAKNREANEALDEVDEAFDKVEAREKAVKQKEKEQIEALKAIDSSRETLKNSLAEVQEVGKVVKEQKNALSKQALAQQQKENNLKIKEVALQNREQKLDKRENDLSSKEVALQNSKQKLDKREDNLNTKYQKDVAALTLRIERTDRREEELNKKEDELTDEKNELTQEIEELRKTKKNLTLHIVTLRDTETDLRDKNKKLKNKNDNLKQENKELSQSTDTARETLMSLNKENDNLNKENSDLRSENANLSNGNDALKQEKWSLEQSLRDLKKDIKDRAKKWREWSSKRAKFFIEFIQGHTKAEIKDREAKEIEQIKQKADEPLLIDYDDLLDQGRENQL